MLTKKLYINLINQFYYTHPFKLHKKLRVVSFINLSFRLDHRYLFLYQIYMYFFLSLYFGQDAHNILLKRDQKRLSLEKGYPMGVKLNFGYLHKFYIFICYFNKWYYYNIFGELKSFFLEKKKGNFFGLKIPFLNLFYLFDYNLITLLLYNLNIPNFKLFVSTTADKYETVLLKNFFGFHN